MTFLAIAKETFFLAVVVTLFQSSGFIYKHLVKDLLKSLKKDGSEMLAVLFSVTLFWVTLYFATTL